jgi:hypothetical protein
MSAIDEQTELDLANGLAEQFVSESSGNFFTQATE